MICHLGSMPSILSIEATLYVDLRFKNIVPGNGLSGFKHFIEAASKTAT